MRSQFEAWAVATRIHDALERPFDIAGHELRTSGSVGIALTDDASAQADDLVRDADVAMYRAKALGKARSEIFDEDLRQLAQARLQLENDLRRAVQRSEFIVHYQPIVSLADGRTTAVEALVRWQHPTGRLAAPAEFLAVAEETGLDVAMGVHVMRAACSQLRVWSDAGIDVTMNLNLSARQIAHPHLVENVAAILADTGVSASQLCFEVTETCLFVDEVGAQTRLHELKALGVRLAIDDFGTGYSSLTYLKQFPFDVLKIDRSFTAGLGVDADDTAIVEAILGLTRVLGLDVVAEGVETEAQATTLRRLGCLLAQGFLYARPADAEVIDFR